MSADNGIYIAKFRDGWRVTHAQATENINYYPPGSKERKNVLKDYFGQSPVFTDHDKAVIYAHRLERDALSGGFSVLEYGVCHVGEYELWEKNPKIIQQIPQIDKLREISKALNDIRARSSQEVTIKYMSKDWAAISQAEIFLDALAHIIESISWIKED